MPHQLQPSRAIGTVVIAALLMGGCDSSPVAPEAAELRLHGGHDQWTLAGTEVPVPPTVLVRSSSGVPVPGVAVTFQVSRGGGTLALTTAVTGPDGTAAVSGWTVGSVPGENQLVATAPAMEPVTFRALALAGDSVPRVQLLSIQNAESGLAAPRHELIDNAEAWHAVWADAYRHHAPAQVPPVPDIDFSQDAVLLAAAGTRGAQGFTYRIEHVALADGVLHAYVLEEYAHCGTLPAMSAPVHAVRVPRMAPTATFELDKRQPICY